MSESVSQASLKRVSILIALVVAFVSMRAIAQVRTGIPTTRPADIPLPSQYVADDQLLIELASDSKAVADAKQAIECVGTISVGGMKSSRKFPLRGRLEDGILDGDFTDDLGNTFTFTARQEPATEQLIFQTGQTTYHLARATGSVGIFRMSLIPVSDGFEIRELVKTGPAERAGVRVGDVITAVDGRSAAGIDSSLLGLRGYAGSEASVTIRHTSGVTGTYTLKREPTERRGFGNFPALPGAPGRNDRRGRPPGR